MENQEIHSKAKLALAVFTSPSAAFEEITRRKLLGTGLVIAAVTGAVATIPPLIAACSGQRVQWLVLGQCNPIAWLGLFMLYALAVQKLLKWVGSTVDYVGLLTLMGWSQLALLLAELSMIVFSIGNAAAWSIHFTQAGLAGIGVFSLWYVVLMGTAVQALGRAPKARGILSYIVIHLAAWIAFTYTYANTRLSAYADALLGVRFTVGLVAYADKLPWAGAAVIGLAAGTMILGKHLEWPSSKLKLRAAGAGLAGLAVLGAYALATSHADYYGKLLRGHRAYINGNYAMAAQNFEALLPASKDNIRLMLDIADVQFLARNDLKALAYYSKCAPLIVRQNPPEKIILLPRAYNGVGTIYDSQGKYQEALAQFEKAKKEWPVFREPWIRMSITYDRMGMYDKAIISGNHAVRNLGSKSTVAWVALAQAFAGKNDRIQTSTAIVMVRSSDRKLAGRIGSSFNDWRTAVDKLSREELKFPLEREPAPEPKKPEKPKKK